MNYFLISPLSFGERTGITSGSHWHKNWAGLHLQEADISLGRGVRLGTAWPGQYNTYIVLIYMFIFYAQLGIMYLFLISKLTTLCFLINNF